MKRALSATAAAAMPPLRTRIHRQRHLFLLLLPAFLLTAVFCYIPLAGWYIAFVDYKIGQNLLAAKWAGLANFAAFFTESSDYIYIIRNTLVMNAATIAVNLTVAVAFAILLKELVSSFFSKAVQTATFFSFFISWVIVYSLAYILFSSSTGAVNETLVRAGLITEGIDVLGSSRHAWGLMIAMNLWRYLGYNSVIFLASITGIPKEQYEAAVIDGANRFHKVRFITLPNLLPTFVVLLILNSGYILSSNMEQFFLFTNATNWEHMEVFDMYIYKYGLELSNYSYATAVGIIKTVVSILILVAVNGISKRLSNRAIF